MASKTPAKPKAKDKPKVKAEAKAEGKEEHWIQGAIKRPGSFKQQAAAAGMDVNEYAQKVLKPGSKASAKTQQRAHLAQTLTKLNKKGSD